jgi:hypothetical protein
MKEKGGTKVRIYMVRQMLIRRSQLQPVTNAAAAGGKRMATCGDKLGLSTVIGLQRARAHDDEADI